MLKQVWMLLWWCLETLGAHPGCETTIELRVCAASETGIGWPDGEADSDPYKWRTVGLTEALLQT